MPRPQTAAGAGARPPSDWRARLPVHLRHVLAGLFVAIVIIHVIRHIHGHSNCSLALSRGVWTADTWQPTGCMLKTFSAPELNRCFPNGGRVVFVGDSRSRQMFQSFVSRLSPTVSTDGLQSYVVAGVRLEYYRETAVWNASVAALYGEWSESDDPPNIVVHNAGLWVLKEKGDAGVLAFRHDFNSLAGAMQRLGARAMVAWRSTGPVVESKLKPERINVTNDRIRHVNDAAEAILDDVAPNVVRLESAVQLYAATAHLSEDGMHYGAVSPVYDAETDLLLNAYCNGERGMPVAWTACCAARPRMSALQGTFWGVALLVACAGAAAAFSQSFSQRAGDAATVGARDAEAPGAVPAPPFFRNDAVHKFVVGGGRMFLVLAYYYMADRTNFFMRANKHFEGPVGDFLLPFLAMMGIGYLYEAGTAQRPGFLNREQTEEWKGWMQVVLLLYHAVGASKSLVVYAFARVIVASYLFLSGYGHFTYFYAKGDFSMNRVMQVLLRLNLLTVFMSLGMGLEYQAYYFVPLSTFWFLVVYVVMRVGHESNKAVAWVVPAKLAGLVAFGAVVWHRTSDGSMPVADALFGHWPVRLLFEDKWSIAEWEFRSGLDRFIVPVGMFTAYLYIVWIPKLERVAPSIVSVVSAVGTVCAAGAVALYFYVASTCPKKEVCNSWHPYTSIGAVVGFAWLRNSTGFLRSAFSPVFVYFGGISLELFLGQYHILLAADTKGLLVLVPGHPYVNAFVVSGVFVIASDVASRATGEIVGALFAADRRTLSMGAGVLASACVAVFLLGRLILWPAF